MKYRIAASAAIAVAAFLFCTNPGVAGKSNDTLVWATHWELESADPYFVQTRANILVTHQIFDGLLHRNPVTFEYEPGLAKSFKWVDNVTMDFDLRDEVLFHNGKKFKA